MNTDCILHTGSVTNAGYGQVARRINGKLKVYGAHRYAWMQTHGPIPDGLHILHQCDNKLCINVEHMRLGTHRENVREAVERGLTKAKRGENQWKHKLTEENVRSIRQGLSAGETVDDLSEKFGVDQITIRRIRSGFSWGWLA